MKTVIVLDDPTTSKFDWLIISHDIYIYIYTHTHTNWANHNPSPKLCVCMCVCVCVCVCVTKALVEAMKYTTWKLSVAIIPIKWR